MLIGCLAFLPCTAPHVLSLLVTSLIPCKPLEGRNFAQYVDNIVFTTKSKDKDLLKKFNALQITKNLQITLESQADNGELAPLDLNICEGKEKYFHANDTISVMLPLQF